MKTLSRTAAGEKTAALVSLHWPPVTDKTEHVYTYLHTQALRVQRMYNYYMTFVPV